MGRKPSASIRDVALRVLREVERADRNLSAALDEVLSATLGLTEGQRRLVTELTYGVLRHRRTLDSALNQASRRPVSKAHPLVLRAMRLAAYQILYLRDARVEVAVDHAVATARRVGGPKTAAYANAVLRRLAANPRLPTEGASLAEAQSLPDWLADLLVSELGPEEAAALAAALNERPPTTLRVNPRVTTRQALAEKLAAEGLQVAPTPFSPWGLKVKGLADPRRRIEYHHGMYEVQDEASQVAAWALGATGARRILDACSGTGGKTLHLAQLHEQATIWALDVHGTRVRQAKDRAARLDVRFQPVLADLRLPPFRPETFDAILLDAPCSGLGALRRHPEAKWRWSPEKIQSVCALQAELLDAAADLLVPGGAILYVVCTFTEAEGPAQARSFLERHPDMKPSPVESELLRPLVDREGWIRTWPHRHDMDAFFMARFEKIGGQR